MYQPEIKHSHCDWLSKVYLEIMEGMWTGVISIPIVEALPNRSSEIQLMAIHCAAVEHGVLINKKLITDEI